MSIPQRVRGIKVLKAISSPLRLQILNLLFDRGPLSYTELISSLRMNPSRDAGRFAYHLKFLLKADLLETDVEARKYCLTELGKMVIDVADRVEKKALKPKGMLTRTSRFTLEEFDQNKIANSLIAEAKIPPELAQRVAKEAERRLLKSRIKYLTAPLIREIVNAILIEKGLEDYRHRLTRLGLPVHEVTTLIEARGRNSTGTAKVCDLAGKTVLSEYTLLNVFPRDIADAHLSGSLHINSLDSWVLQPIEIMHDIRFFLQNGLDLGKIDPTKASIRPPQSFEEALYIILSVLLHSAREIEGTQTIAYFNIFLAPFIKGIDQSRIKEALRSFLLTLNGHAATSLGLETVVPPFMSEKPAIGLCGKPTGKYADFAEEIQQLASYVLAILSEESMRKPLLNPRIVVNIRQETIADKKAEALFLQAHESASKNGTIHFGNLLNDDEKHSVLSASGFKLTTDPNGDWEIDTLRTGCLGSVTINLPRVVYESEKDKTKFFELLSERLEMATRALEIKQKTLRQHDKNLLPFLAQSVDGDQYFRLQQCSTLINVAGLKEAAEAFCGKDKPGCGEPLQFADDIVQNILSFVHRVSRGRRQISVAMIPNEEASERLAQLDIEKYGVAKVKFSGTRDKPYYSTANRMTLVNNAPDQQDMIAIRKLTKLLAGGDMTVIELGNTELKDNELLAVTKQIIENEAANHFTYNRKLTYCANCKRSWFGVHHKCPSCGAIGTLTGFDQYATV